MARIDPKVVSTNYIKLNAAVEDQRVNTKN